MAVRDGIDAHLMLGNPVCAYSKNNSESRWSFFNEGNIAFC